MESRKIQKSASGSYMVTLPKAWTEDAGLEKGDRVEFHIDNDGSLKINTHKTEEKKVAKCILSLDHHSDETALDRRIKSAYMQGHDVINIVSKGTIMPKWKKAIKESLQDLIGAEISEEFSNRISIVTLVDANKFPMDTLIRRMSTLAFSMHQDAVHALLEYDLDLATDVVSRGGESNKLYRLIMRELTQFTPAMEGKSMTKMTCETCAKTMRGCPLLTFVARDLSRMAYYARDIAAQVEKLNMKEIPAPVKSRVKKMHDFAHEMGETAIKAFLADDFELANEVINKVYKIRKLHSDVDTAILENISDIHDAVLLTRITRDIRRISGYSVMVADDTQMKLPPKIFSISQSDS